jgi:SAM-dependent methyltransferase
MYKFCKKIVKKLISLCGFEIRNKYRTLSFTNEKYEHELGFWIDRHNAENKRFNNSNYKKIMLDMSQESNDIFLTNKIVVDFGCGPRGSLVWTQVPKLRIGVDVLVDKYYDYFGNDMIDDGYLYVKSTEKYIPIPTEFVDVVFTLNSLDHTDNFEVMLNELFRILKAGGEFIGCFNMNEPATICEPQKLTFQMMEKLLFPKLDIKHKITAFNYDDFLDNTRKQPSENDICKLCIRGKKK